MQKECLYRNIDKPRLKMIGQSSEYGFEVETSKTVTCGNIVDGKRCNFRCRYILVERDREVVGARVQDMSDADLCEVNRQQLEG